MVLLPWQKDHIHLVEHILFLLLRIQLARIILFKIPTRERNWDKADITLVSDDKPVLNWLSLSVVDV